MGPRLAAPPIKGVKMASPRISVIIPIHNADKYLEQCLDSILSQTEMDIEVICVNDSSTDNSQAILDRYAQSDSRTTVLYASCHCAGAARNIGMSHATGDYLSFLDADDFFEPNMLQETADAMDETNSDVAIYGSWIYDTVRGSNRQAKWNLRTDLIPDTRVFSWQDMSDYILNAFSNNPWNKMFRTQFIRDSKISYQEISRANDLYFTCVALIKAEKITVIDKPYVHYRIDSMGSLQSTKDQDPACFIKAYDELGAFLATQNLENELKRSFLNHLLDGVIHNVNSVRSLDSISVIRKTISEFLEPRYQLLSQPEDFFYDYIKISEYRSFLMDDTTTYLFKRSQQLNSSREDMYWHADWLERKLWQANERIALQDMQIRDMQSHRLRNLILAPFKLLKGANSKQKN